MFIPDDWFCWQELGEVAIQSDGSFSAEICFWCPDDFPDLYFEVIQTIGGLERMFDSSGNLVTCSNLGGPGPFKFVLPDLSTATEYTSVLTSNNITPAGQLFFRVRVDNNDTVAQLTDVDTSVPCTTDCDCGMHHYTTGSDLAPVHYAATHPYNFLTWGLSITRDTAGTVASASGATSSTSMLPPPMDTVPRLSTTVRQLSPLT